MRNIYCVKLAKAIEISKNAPHFGSSTTAWLYVVASSFQAAQEAVMQKHPTAEVREMSLLNYSGVPIVLGD